MNLKVKFAGLESLLFEDLCRVDIPDEGQHIISSSAKKSIFNGSTDHKLLPKQHLQRQDSAIHDELNDELKKMDVSDAVPVDTDKNFDAPYQATPINPIRDSIINFMFVI